MPDSKEQANIIPTICLTCNREAELPFSRLATLTSLVCVCGSSEVDLDDRAHRTAEFGEWKQTTPHPTEPEDERSPWEDPAPGDVYPNAQDREWVQPGDPEDTSNRPQASKQAYNDPPMDLYDPANAVSEMVTCSNCGNLFRHVATDPAQPLPVCPNCGGPTSVAGSTNTQTVGAKVSRIVLSDEEKAGLREVDGAFLKPGDRVFNPSMGTAYQTAADGRVSFGTMGFAPIDGTVWTVESNDGHTMTARSEEGRVSGGPIPSGHKMLRMGVNRSSKLVQIAEAVLSSNPGMTPKLACEIAQRTLERYPKVAAFGEEPCPARDKHGGECVYAKGHEARGVKHRFVGGDEQARFNEATEKWIADPTLPRDRIMGR